MSEALNIDELEPGTQYDLGGGVVVEVIDLERDIQFDDRNANKGREYGQTLLENSVSRFKAGRGMLLDKARRVMAGNKSTHALIERGVKRGIVVRTTGDVAVFNQRDDIDLTTNEGRAFAHADNKVAQENIDPDNKVLAEFIREGVDFTGILSEGEVSTILLEDERGGAKGTGRDIQPDDDDQLLNTYFESDNPFGVPTLDLKYQAGLPTEPYTKWGAVAHSADITGGTQHFYTDDVRFVNLWFEPAQALMGGAAQIVEPNYSTTDEMPVAVVLKTIYEKRWLARYWQEKGARVYVDLNVSPARQNPKELPGLALLGVPPGWLAYMTRAHKGAGEEAIDRDFELACERAGTSDIIFVVNGGSRRIREHCESRGYLWKPEDLFVASQRKKARLAAVTTKPPDEGAEGEV